MGLEQWLPHLLDAAVTVLGFVGAIFYYTSQVSRKIGAYEQRVEQLLAEKMRLEQELKGNREKFEAEVQRLYDHITDSLREVKGEVLTTINQRLSDLNLARNGNGGND